jgi:broad specificity phosphatase PhoE
MENNYCTFYIVRHGQTIWNVERRVQGQKDSPLTELGKQQAKETAEKLKHISFDKIFSSDSGRAVETAEILKLEHEIAVLTTKALRERSFGPYEGKPIHELRQFDKIYGGLDDEGKKNFKSHSEAESDLELVSRFITFLRETAIAFPGQKILVVTHSGMMRALLIHLGFLTYKAPFHAISNASYAKLRSDGIDFFVDETEGIIKK